MKGVGRGKSEGRNPKIEGNPNSKCGMVGGGYVCRSGWYSRHAQGSIAEVTSLQWRWRGAACRMPRNPNSIMNWRCAELAGGIQSLCASLAEVYFTGRYPGFDLEDPDWPHFRIKLE